MNSFAISAPTGERLTLAVRHAESAKVREFLRRGATEEATEEGATP